MQPSERPLLASMSNSTESLPDAVKSPALKLESEHVFMSALTNKVVDPEDANLSAVSLSHVPHVRLVLRGGPSSHLTGAPLMPLTHVADTIDARMEEAFTLETLESLMAAARAKNVDFCVARVTTVDPSDENKFYYQYYQGHQINRVLFRTQPEEGYLHRMKARNPLNNMVIVGDVHYFTITPAMYDETRRKFMQREMRRSGAVLQTVKRASLDDVRQVPDLMHDRPALDSDNNDIVMQSIRRSFSEDAMEVVNEIEENVDKDDTLVFNAHFFATDDDFLMKTTVREFFKRNSVEDEDYVLFQLFRPDELVIHVPPQQPQTSDANAGDDLVLETRNIRNLFGLLPRRMIARRPPSATPRFRYAFKWFLLAYFVVGFVIVKFVVPSTFTLLAGILLIFLLAFVTVLFLECDM